MSAEYTACIRGFGAHVPKKVLTNADLEKMVKTTDEWIRSRTGIQERRIAEKGQKSSDLGVVAAREALQNSMLYWVVAAIRMANTRVFKPTAFTGLPQRYSRSD